jgi:nucleotide-binding universal stress UspA family protein
MVRSSGSLSSEIVGYAEKENVDLIVMGTRGKRKMKKCYLAAVLQD